MRIGGPGTNINYPSRPGFLLTRFRSLANASPEKTPSVRRVAEDLTTETTTTRPAITIPPAAAMSLIHLILIRAVFIMTMRYLGVPVENCWTVLYLLALFSVIKMMVTAATTAAQRMMIAEHNRRLGRTETMDLGMVMDTATIVVAMGTIIIAMRAVVSSILGVRP